MPIYRVHRLKENPRQAFRWAAHTAGAATVKPKDYDQVGEVEAPSPYGAWSALQNTEKALVVGDVLEDPLGGLRIYKYVGFEEARWFIPEPAPPRREPEEGIIGDYGRPVL